MEEAGFPRPTVYTNGERDFERLCAEEELELVYTATPWEWHVPVLLSAMENGKHAATEVPAAYTIDDCWAMVEAAERLQKHCVLMENCNYGRMEMLCFHLVKLGLLGEIVHAEGGYLHDLRAIKFEDRNEGLWRRAHSMQRNGNLYPSHGLGPGGQLHGHQPGGPVRLPGLHEQPLPGPPELGPGQLSPRRPQAAGKLRLRGRELLHDPDGSGPDHPGGARLQPSPALFPHQHGPGHQGDLPAATRTGSTSRA